MFFCEFYKIFKNTFFTEHLQAAAFECSALPSDLLLLQADCPATLAQWNLSQWINCFVKCFSPGEKSTQPRDDSCTILLYRENRCSKFFFSFTTTFITLSIKFFLLIAFYFIRSCSFQHYFMLTICQQNVSIGGNGPLMKEITVLAWKNKESDLALHCHEKLDAYDKEVLILILCLSLNMFSHFPALSYA